MTYAFHPAAEIEFREAIEYYESREEGLGFDFAHEVYSAIGRAAEHPRAWPVLDRDIRRCQTRRFPYGVLYSQEKNGIYVLAVMHLHRQPDYWKHRS